MSKSRKEGQLWKRPSFSQCDLEVKQKNKISFKNLAKSKSFTYETETVDLTLSPEESKNKIDVKKVQAKNFENWIDKFEPQLIDDLAVHNKKVDEVRNFFKHCDFMAKKGTRNQIALLSGPSGAGKTTTLKILAKLFDFKIVEWINPVDIDIETNSSFNQSSKESQLTLFKRFIFQSSRYNTLFENTITKRILLIEDFPNFIIRDSNLFDEILEYFKLYGKSPLVFIVTDSRSRELNLTFNLFPDNIKEKHDIMHISFNSVAVTLMKKALKRISQQILKEPTKNLYNTLNQDTIDSICLSADGDIRNAVINLYFASLKGGKNLQLKSSETRKTKKNQTKNKTLSSIGRDETITLMHALGRVFHPKYKEVIEGNLFLHSPEELTNQFLLDHKHFVDFIHTNYINHFSNIENVEEAADNLSLSDNFMVEFRETNMGTIGLNVAIRGIMVSNKNPISKWSLVKGINKTHKKSLYKKELKQFGLPCNISNNVFATDMRSYVKIINS